MNASPLPRLLQSFFRAHLIVRRDVSKHTVSAYRDAIKAYLVFAAARAGCEVADLALDHMGRDVLLDFLEHLEVHRHNGAATRNARLAAIRCFFRYVASEDPAQAFLCQQVLSVPFKRAPAGVFTFLEREEVERVLRSIDRSTAAGRRDAALVQFLYNTGARAQEVADLRAAAVRFEHPAQVLIRGKGRKERLNPLWPETVGLALEMLRDRGAKPGDDVPFFVNEKDGPLTRFGVRHIVRRCIARAMPACPALGTRRLSPHSIRHSTALHMIQSGIDLNVVRCWLGHSSIETTHAYVEIDMKMKAAALERCTSPDPGRPPSWREPDLLAWLESL